MHLSELSMMVSSVNFLLEEGKVIDDQIINITYNLGDKYLVIKTKNDTGIQIPITNIPVSDYDI